MRIAIIKHALVALVASLALPAHADSRLPLPVNPRWQEECGGCHLAYPPSLLPPSSWQRLIAGLDRHFGVDAGLDPAGAAAIGEFLERNAASGKRAITGGSGLRISESPWFVREHRKVDAATWKLPAVKSAANCAACHTNATAGDYGERGIRIPR